MENNKVQYFLMVRSSKEGNSYYWSNSEGLAYKHKDDEFIVAFKSSEVIPESKLNIVVSLINKRRIEFSKIRKLFTFLTHYYHTIKLRNGVYYWTTSDSFDLQRITNEDIEQIVDSFEKDKVTENQLNAIVSHRNNLYVTNFK